MSRRIIAGAAIALTMIAAGCGAQAEHHDNVINESTGSVNPAIQPGLRQLFPTSAGDKPKTPYDLELLVNHLKYQRIKLPDGRDIECVTYDGGNTTSYGIDCNWMPPALENVDTTTDQSTVTAPVP